MMLSVVNHPATASCRSDRALPWVKDARAPCPNPKSESCRNLAGSCARRGQGMVDCLFPSAPMSFPVRTLAWFAAALLAASVATVDAEQMLFEDTFGQSLPRNR